MDGTRLFASLQAAVGIWSFWAHFTGSDPGLGATPNAYLGAGCLFVSLAVGTFVGQAWPPSDGFGAWLTKHDRISQACFWAALLGLGLWFVSGNVTIAPTVLGASFGYIVGISSDRAERVRQRRCEAAAYQERANAVLDNLRTGLNRAIAIDVEHDD